MSNDADQHVRCEEVALEHLLRVHLALENLLGICHPAFEFVCDVVSPEFHGSVERAKDIAAGAVLICAGGAVVIGVLTFGP